MSNKYFEHEFDNSLHLLVEPLAGVRSAAMTVLVPGGAASDPEGANGCANLVSELTTRGAGPNDSRALNLALDNLGIHRNENAEIFHTAFSSVGVADNLISAMGLIADIVRRPHLDGEHLDACRAATLQELQAIEDDPGQKLSIELKRRALPHPLGRPIIGAEEDVERISRDEVVDFHRRTYRPNGAIIGVAGAVDFPKIRDRVGELFGDWNPSEATPVSWKATTPTRSHLHSEKVQTHIGISFDAVCYRDPDFFNAHGAVGVLSGGMSARLFTEVREKRGLCYSVGASFHPLRDLGVIYLYSSTTNERALATLEVLIAELERLRQGIGDDEVRRLQAGLKSSLIMQEESTSARASILAHGWYNLGRVRTLDEVAREIDRITAKGILEYLDRHPPVNLNILTLGPKPLEETA